MSSFGFSNPWLLLLAIPFAVAVYLGLRRSRSPLTPVRIWVGGLAIGAFLLATLATVSGFYTKAESDTRTVWILVDQSLSTGENSQKQLPDALTRLKASLRETDYVGVIALDTEFKLPDASPNDETWIASAVNLARSSTPEGTSPVALLLTDGFDSTLRYEEDLARDLRIAGISVFPLPVDSKPWAEVALSACDVRVAGKENTELAIDLTAYATEAQTARPQIRVSGKVVSQDLIDTTGKLDSNGNWKLAQGRNLLRLRLTPPTVAPAYVVEVALASEADTFPGNNAIKLNVRGQGDARALLIHGANGPEPSLVRAIEGANMPVTQGRASMLPSEDAELARFQVLILSDVPATDFSTSQMKLIEKGRKRVPAMVVALDRSGSMTTKVGNFTKMELANEGCVKAIKLIPPGSFFGMLSVDTSPNWPVEIQKVDRKNRNEVIALARGNTPGGGGIYVDIAIREGLGALQTTESISKHLVLFSDGSDTERQEGVIDFAADAFKKHKISISTICLGSGPDWPFLQALAKTAGGRAFLVNDEQPRLVERTFVKIRSGRFMDNLAC
ncbi:MAG: VWA domain-containing protein [Planctomycetota bacterium]